MGGSDTAWSNGLNWAHGPTDAPGAPTAATAIACIGGFSSITVDTNVNVQALHLSGAAISVDPGQALFVNGPAASVWDADSVVGADQAAFGGTGTIELHGRLDASDTVLSSVPGGPGSVCGATGLLAVMPDGLFTVQFGSLSLRACYQISVSGVMTLGTDGGFVTADHGTSTIINAGGTLDLQGDGGYYQGSPVAGRSIGSLGNSGTLVKSLGDNPSVVDASYVQTSTGTVRVQSGTLSLPGAGFVAGTVAAGSSFGTAACGTSPSDTCPGSQNPAVDPMSVSFTVPASNPGPANVQLQELPDAPDTSDSRAIGNDVFAHAEQLQPAPGDYATIHLR
jgi:hypothetical protein